MTENQPPEDAWDDVPAEPIPSTEEPPQALPVAAERPVTTTENPAEGFQLNLAEAVALINERTTAGLSVSQFRTVVSQGDGPQPLTWGRTPLWGLSTVEEWISMMLATGVLRAPSPEVQEQTAENGEPAPELIFGSTAEWVEKFLLPMYRREISPNGAGLTWCPQWWQHAEAIIRLEALWRAWEFLRLDGKTGMSVFMKDHLDHHMTVLLDGQGPFDGCSLDQGHAQPPAGIKQFVIESPPPELFPDVRQPNSADKGDQS